MSVDLLVLLLFLPIIIGSAITDFQQFKIRNVQVLAALGLFVLVAPFLLDGQEILARGFAAAVTFGLCFVLFALRVIGGGDAKMMPVVLLFIPSAEAVVFLRIFAVALALVSIVAYFAHRRPRLRPEGGTATQASRQVPVGVAMALSVAAMALVIGTGG